MSYFLSPAPLKTEEIVEVAGDEARHILLSRRIEIGEMIELQGPDGKRYEAEVVAIDRHSVTLQAIEEILVPEESPLKITVFQALIKEQPLDFIIQKATELGADKLILFSAENSVERFKDMTKKLERWGKIALEAAKQSGRVRPISIEYVDDKDKIKEAANELDKTFLLEPTSHKTFLNLFETDRVAAKVGILVGPEGGFTEEEIAEFSKIRNIEKVAMGPRILRADTAAIASAAIVQALWGDL